MPCDVADPWLVLGGALLCLGIAGGVRLAVGERTVALPAVASFTVALLALVLIGVRLPAGCGVDASASARRVVDGEPAVTSVERPSAVSVVPRPSGQADIAVSSQGWPEEALVSVALCKRFDLPATGRRLYEMIPAHCLGVLAQDVADSNGRLIISSTVDFPESWRAECSEADACTTLLADMESLQVASQPFSFG